MCGLNVENMGVCFGWCSSAIEREYGVIVCQMSVHLVGRVVTTIVVSMSNSDENTPESVESVTSPIPGSSEDSTAPEQEEEAGIEEDVSDDVCSEDENGTGDSDFGLVASRHEDQHYFSLSELKRQWKAAEKEEKRRKLVYMSRLYFLAHRLTVRPLEEEE